MSGYVEPTNIAITLTDEEWRTVITVLATGRKYLREGEHEALDDIGVKLLRRYFVEMAKRGR